MRIIYMQFAEQHRNSILPNQQEIVLDKRKLPC